jgi:hypothetical protein
MSCVYICNVEELVSAMWSALDNVEGDFTRKTLKMACIEVAKKYKPVIQRGMK